MTLKNEIFEGIAAYKGLSSTPQDDYYKYRLQQLKNKQKDDDAVAQGAKDEVDAQNKRRMGGPAGTTVPTVASTSMPGSTQTAMNTSSWDPTQAVSQTNMPVDRRGGMIRRFADGGRAYEEPYQGLHNRPYDVEDKEMAEDADRAAAKLLLNKSVDPRSERGGTGWGNLPDMSGRRPGDDSEFSFRHGGAVALFADGGGVPGGGPDIEDPPDSPPIDNLIKELLQRGNDQAAERISRDVGEPWTVTGPTSEWAKQGADQRVADLAKTRAAQERDTQAFQTSAPPVEPSSRAGRVLNSISEFVNPTGSGGEYKRRQQDLADVRAARDKIPGLFTPSTEGEITTAQEAAAAKQRDVARGGPEPPTEPPDPTDPANVAGIQPKSAVDRYTEARNAVLDTKVDLPAIGDIIPSMVRNAAGQQPVPTGAGAGTGAGAQQVAAAAPRTTAPPTALRPVAPWTQQSPQSSLGVPPAALQGSAPAPAPTPAPAPAPAPAPVPPKPSGPTGTATTPAPPPGAGGANAPSTAPKGSLRDQTRETAFNPVADINDPDNAHKVDQSGQVVQPTQQDMHTVLAAGMTAAPGGGAQQPPPGQGAVSRPVFNQWIAAHNQGGRLTSGQALIAGMVGKYKVLLSQGRQAEAAQMAWGLIQAANLEAASWGDVAADHYRNGNQRGVTTAVANAADLQPDGMHHRPSADGKSIETYDNNGKLTATTPMSGQTALAAIMGLRDGTLMWNALQSAVASMQKPDKNAEGRALTNDLRRQQIEGARLRNRKLASGGGGGGGGGTAADQQLAALFQQTNPGAHTSGGRSQGGGEDDSWIDRETRDPDDE